jgi:hypothetical protein
MDMAQQTLDSVVEQAKQLGHDAMESAYDVDQLFSEWRCNNCGLEGRADISDDGQVAFSGDLLDGPQGCPNPVVQPGADPTGQTDPNAAAAPAVPADPAAAAPVVPQPTVQASKGKFTRWRNRKNAASEVETDINANRSKLNEGGHNEPDEKQAPSSGSISPDPGGELEEKVSQLIEDIQLTNPGMNEKTARHIARETVRRYPSVVAFRKTAGVDDNIMLCRGYEDGYHGKPHSFPEDDGDVFYYDQGYVLGQTDKKKGNPESMKCGPAYSRL